MNTPLVSVIIPCFNAAHFIRDAIQSALTQTHPAVEILVVDDGSTDNSLEIVRSFGPRVRCDSVTHAGATAARNRGLRAAAGEWIQFLDADDLLMPEKIERQLQARTDEDRIVFCDYEAVSALTGATIPMPMPPFTGGDPIPFILQRQLSTAAPLHPKKQLLNVGGFDESLPCAQEYDLHLRLACNGAHFVHLPVTLSRVRKRTGSLSSDYVKILAQYPRILQRAYGILGAAGTMTDERARAFAETMARAGRHLLQRQHRNEGIEAFRLARRMHREGGLGVYRTPARWLHRLLGPVIAETLVLYKRRLLDGGSSASP